MVAGHQPDSDFFGGSQPHKHISFREAHMFCKTDQCVFVMLAISAVVSASGFRVQVGYDVRFASCVPRKNRKVRQASAGLAAVHAGKNTRDASHLRAGRQTLRWYATRLHGRIVGASPCAGCFALEGCVSPRVSSSQYRSPMQVIFALACWGGDHGTKARVVRP